MQSACRWHSALQTLLLPRHLSSPEQMAQSPRQSESTAHSTKHVPLLCVDWQVPSWQLAVSAAVVGDSALEPADAFGRGAHTLAVAAAANAGTESVQRPHMRGESLRRQAAHGQKLCTTRG